MRFNVPKIGEIFEDRYELLGRLGAGSYAVVYKARQLKVGREVAIKVLLPSDDGFNPTILERFQREARLTSSLRHPNSIILHDFGWTDQEHPYLVTEFIPGVTLRDVCNGIPLTPAKAKHIAIQILGSLNEAHTRGIVHRDLKPANIMLFDRADEKDVVKVLDFGIAKFMDESAGADLEIRNDLTARDRFMGTPRYMAPEQLTKIALAPATDVYAVGLLFYEMLTGRPAVEGTTSTVVISRQLDPEPLIDPKDKAVPKALRKFLLHCTEKHIDDRLQDAGEALAVLEALNLEGLPAAPYVPRKDGIVPNKRPTGHTPRPMASARLKKKRLGKKPPEAKAEVPPTQLKKKPTPPKLPSPRLNLSSKPAKPAFPNAKRSRLSKKTPGDGAPQEMEVVTDILIGVGDIVEAIDKDTPEEKVKEPTEGGDSAEGGDPAEGGDSIDLFAGDWVESSPEIKASGGPPKLPKPSEPTTGPEADKLEALEPVEGDEEPLLDAKSLEADEETDLGGASFEEHFVAAGVEEEEPLPEEIVGEEGEEEGGEEEEEEADDEFAAIQAQREADEAAGFGTSDRGWFDGRDKPEGEVEAAAAPEPLPPPVVSSGLPKWVYAAAAVLFVIGTVVVIVSMLPGDDKPGGEKGPVANAEVVKEDPEKDDGDGAVVDAIEAPPKNDGDEAGGDDEDVEEPPPEPRKILVQTTPAGAVVRLDDKVLGQTPLFISRVEGEETSVTVEHDDYVSQTVEITATEEREEIQIDLEPKAAASRRARRGDTTTRRRARRRGPKFVPF